MKENTANSHVIQLSTLNTQVGTSAKELTSTTPIVELTMTEVTAVSGGSLDINKMDVDVIEKIHQMGGLELVMPSAFA